MSVTHMQGVLYRNDANEKEKQSITALLGKCWFKNFKSFYRGIKGILWIILTCTSYTLVVVEDAFAPHIGMTFFKSILAVLLLTPTLYSITLTFLKDYVCVKNQQKFNFVKNKKKLQKEYKTTLNINFDKEKDNNLNNIEDRYLLDSKEKKQIYEKIAILTDKIRTINNSDYKEKFALETMSILLIFDEARKKFENMDSNKIQLILQDKIKIEVDILFKLDILEEQIDNYINKENRMLEDEEKTKVLKMQLAELSGK